jgi:hypothetical protein
MSRKPFAILIIASSLAAFGGLAQAQTTSPAARSATASPSGVAFMTGGVGLVARQELASQAGQYNLHLEFAYAPEGEYLSEVQVDINDARGNNLLSTRTDGPWLLARLPAGSYTVKATYGGVTRSQQVTVGGGKRHLVMRFPASVENMAGRYDAATPSSVASR